jgi:hypothetical protein
VRHSLVKPSNLLQNKYILKPTTTFYDPNPAVAWPDHRTRKARKSISLSIHGIVQL